MCGVSGTRCLFWRVVIFERHGGLLEVNHAFVARVLLDTVLVANMQNAAMGFANRTGVCQPFIRTNDSRAVTLGASVVLP